MANFMAPFAGAQQWQDNFNRAMQQYAGYGGNNGWQQALMGNAYNNKKLDDNYDIQGWAAENQSDSIDKQYKLGKYDSKNKLRMNEYNNDTQLSMNTGTNANQFAMNTDNNQTRRYGIDKRRETVLDFLPMIQQLTSRGNSAPVSYRTAYQQGPQGGVTSDMSRLLYG